MVLVFKTLFQHHTASFCSLGPLRHHSDIKKAPLLRFVSRKQRRFLGRGLAGGCCFLVVVLCAVDVGEDVSEHCFVCCSSCDADPCEFAVSAYSPECDVAVVVCVVGESWPLLGVDEDAGAFFAVSLDEFALVDSAAA